MKNILKALSGLVVIFIVLVLSEMLYRKHKLKNEDSRKIIHIFVASFVAIWPFYMSYHYIEVISVAFFLVIFLSRYFNVFKSIHKTKRKSLGDILFPISIFLSALLSPSRIVFVIVMLNLGLSDGLAAIIGSRFGKRNKRLIFGQTKSLAGSAAFWLSSFLVLLIIKLSSVQIAHLNWPLVFILPTVTALVELVSVYGLDNLAVPAVIIVLLRWL